MAETSAHAHHHAGGNEEASHEVQREHAAYLAARDGCNSSATFLIATCPCGCGKRPQVAGLATAPGYALLPMAPALAPQLDQPLPVGDGALVPDADVRAIEHVPLLS